MNEIIKTTIFDDKINIVMKDGGLIPAIGKITEIIFEDGRVERKVYISPENITKALNEFNNH